MLAKFAVGKGLNVGCGKVPIADSIGVDIDRTARACQVLANGQNLPFKDGELDYVLSLHNLEHYHCSALIVMKEWVRVVKPGGIVAAIVPDGDRGMDAFFAGSGQHYHVFTLQTLPLYFQQAGLEIVECRKIDRTPERSEQTLLCVGRKPA
jgi:SAM-dependent methyltransferase